MSTSTTSRKRRFVAGGIAVAAVAATAALTTTALFTDDATIDGNLFTSGTVSLSTTPTTKAVTLAAMMPGDTVTAPITVLNDGSGALRYALKSTTTGDAGLAAGLTMTVKTGLTAANCAAWTGGTPVFTGALGSSAGLKVIGDALTGDQADRPLAAGASEVLCVQVSLPKGASDQVLLGGKTTTATFTFNAEQTANNN